MSNGWATFSTIVAWFLFIGGIIASLIWAIIAKSFIPIAVGVPSATLSLCLFGTLGYIADNVSAPEMTNYKWHPVLEQPKWSMPNPSSEKSAWICPDCGKQNEGSAAECSCGKTRPLK